MENLFKEGVNVTSNINPEKKSPPSTYLNDSERLRKSAFFASSSWNFENEQNFTEMEEE